jgi:lipopolysaccharide transport protein LptA
MHSWRARAATVLGTGLLALAGTCCLSARTCADEAAGTDSDNCREPVCLNAARLEADSTHLVLHDFDIVYAARGTTVKGDLAEGESTDRDSKNTHWVLTGHVDVTMPQGHLSADRATMQIVNGRITILTAQGSPALFERAAGGPPVGGNPGVQNAIEHARGHAREIVYDLDRNQLDLSGDSYLTNGCYEFSSEHMSYDIANQRVQADPRDSAGVRGKIIRERAAGTCSGNDRP